MKIAGEKKTQDILAGLFLASAVVYLFWRAPVGFGIWDEHWYITFGHRFSLGDSMLTDEWNVIQLFSFVLYLPVRIFLALNGSTQGIILALRYLYILFAASSATAMYCLTRKHGPVSLFCLLLTILFVPAGLMSVGYYSLITFLSPLLGLLLLHEKRSEWALFTVGVLFAVLVLANPFLVIVFFGYTLGMIFFIVYHKKQKTSSLKCPEFFGTKTWLWITAGSAAVAVFFVWFLLSGTTWREILANIPHILGDSEYNLTGIDGQKQNIFEFRQSLSDFVAINPYLMAVYAVLFSIVVFDKHRSRRRSVYLLVTAVFTVAFLFYLISSADFYLYLLCMLPLAMAAPIVFILTQRKEKKIFYFLWVWGVVLAFFQDISSNQGIRLMSFGLFSSALASLLLMNALIVEMKSESAEQTGAKKHKEYKIAAKRIAISSLVFLMFVQTGIQARILADEKTGSAEYFYRALGNFPALEEEMNYRIQEGPAKGLLTIESSARVYEDMLEDLALIRDNGEGPFLLLGRFPWAYLFVDKPYATFTTAYLIWKLPETAVRLSAYYTLHPEKYPAFIYIPYQWNLFITNEMIKQTIPEADLTQQALDYVEETYDCSITPGKAGYIVRVFR